MNNSNLDTESKKLMLEDEDDNHQPENRLEGLPRDIVFEIVSRLSVRSTIQFTFVCKTFDNFWRDPDLVRIHQSRAAKNNPCLIFHRNYLLNNQLYFVDLDHDERVRKFQTPFPESMAEFNVVGSCEGILCFVNSVNDIVYIYNPFTRQYKELPRSIEFQDQEVMYGFGFHPITMEYKVIKIIYYANTSNENNEQNRQFIMTRYNRCEVLIISLSENKWRSLGEIPYLLDHKSTVTLVNGRLHWLRRFCIIETPIRDGLIISFDLSDELFKEVFTPGCVDCRNVHGCHLAVLSGCLSTVVRSWNILGGFDIWMMKEYNVKESWVKQFRIEHYHSSLFDRFHTIWSNMLRMTDARVLCLLKNGEILIEYNIETLVSYNPQSGRFRELRFPGLPQFYRTCIHFGSLNWIG